MADPVSAAGTAVGIIALGIQVCQGLVRFYDSWKGGQQQVQRTTDCIDGLLAVLRQLESVVGADAFPAENAGPVLASLQKCRNGIQELQEELGKVNREDVPAAGAATGLGEMLRSHGGPMLYPFRESTLLRLREAVADVRANLTLAVQALQLSTAPMPVEWLDNMSKELGKLEKSMREIALNQGEEKYREVIAWLSKIPCHEKQQSVLKRYEMGTDGFFFQSDEFSAWSQGRRRLLWCFGDPGTGKTILASAVVDHLERSFLTSPKVGIAFAYCQYADRQAQTVEELLGSLSQQLLQRNLESQSDEALRLHETHSIRRTRPGRDELLALLTKLLQGFHSTYIVVDGIDEGEERTMKQLMADLCALGGSSRILFTSRDVPDIRAQLKDATAFHVRAQEADMARFLSAQILREPTLQSMCERSPDLRDKIITTVIQRSDGIFLLTSLHLLSLSTKLQQKQVEEALEELPEGIENTYADAMDRILNGQPAEKTRIARNILTWMCVSKWPLALLDIQEITTVMEMAPKEMRIDSQDMISRAQVLSVCAGIIAFEKRPSYRGADGELVRFVHHTMDGFFARNHDRYFPGAHAAVARTCMRLVGLAARQRRERRPGSGGQPHDAGAHQLGDQMRAYALKKWFLHVDRADETAILEDLVEFLCDAETMKFMIWWYRELKVHVPEYEWQPPFKSLKDVVDLGSLSSSPLHLAAAFGFEEAASRLVPVGNGVNATIHNGLTPLHVALLAGRRSMAWLLIRQGADVDARCRWYPFEQSDRYAAGIDGGTFLHVAAVQRWQGLISWLLEEGGADVDARDDRGYTPLMAVLADTQLSPHDPPQSRPGRRDGVADFGFGDDGDGDPVVEALLRAGAGVNCVSRRGHTPLCLAARRCHLRMLRRLRDAGASINVGCGLRDETMPANVRAVVEGLLAEEGAGGRRTPDVLPALPPNWEATRGQEGQGTCGSGDEG